MLLTQNAGRFGDIKDREYFVSQLKWRLEDQGVSEGIRLSWRKQSDGKFFHKEEETKKKKKTRPEEDEL